MNILYMAIAGVAGTLARYWFGGAVQKAYGGVFPWGTFAVNMAGCFLFGLVWALAEERLVISSQTRIILLVGFMGAFTTFSSYMFETTALLRDSQWLLAAVNFGLQNFCGFVFLLLGTALGRQL